MHQNCVSEVKLLFMPSNESEIVLCLLCCGLIEGYVFIESRSIIVPIYKRYSRNRKPCLSTYLASIVQIPFFWHILVIDFNELN